MNKLKFFILLTLLWADLSTGQPLNTEHDELRMPESRTKFDDDLREVVEFLKLQMTCGYPPLGVPPLSPFEMAYENFEYQDSVWWLKGNFSDFQIHGLNEFDVVELQWNNILAKITFDFKFPLIDLNSLYQMNMYTPLKIFGNGIFSLQLFNLRLTGSLKLKTLSIINSGLTVRDFKIKVALESSSSKTTGIMDSRWSTKLFNAWLEEFIALTLEEEEAVSRVVEEHTVPLLNKALKHISLVELVSLITGIANDVVPNGPKCDF